MITLRGQKGTPLTFAELDNNFITLENDIQNISLTPGPTGPTGPAGEIGPTGPAAPISDLYLDWAAAAEQTTQGPFQVIANAYRALPFSGQGIIRPGGSILGTTASNGFGIKLSENGSGIGRAFKIMAAVDMVAGNNKVIGLRLRVYERFNEFSAWVHTDILLSECRAFTGNTFGKLFTEWIYVPSNNDEEVVVTVANHTDSGFNNISIDRIKMVVTDLGPAF